jgi:hypothetical protein
MAVEARRQKAAEHHADRAHQAPTPKPQTQN